MNSFLAVCTKNYRAYSLQASRVRSREANQAAVHGSVPCNKELSCPNENIVPERRLAELGKPSLVTNYMEEN